MTLISDYISQKSRLIAEISESEIETMIDILLKARDSGNKIFLCGNGGSAATASHFACDLGKGTISNSKIRFKVISLSDSIPLITAWANDTDYSNIFAEQLDALVEPGDVLLAISCSGNSPNILKAVELANCRGAFTVGLSGFKGGKLKELCQFCLVVPSNNMQQIEDVHLVVTHLLTTCLREAIKNEGSST